MTSSLTRIRERLAGTLFAVHTDGVDKSTFTDIRADVERLLALASAADTLTDEHCREPDCPNRAEFVLWGKLLPAEALGPRCYDHAAKHVGSRSLGDPQWAIMDLRPTRRALAALDIPEGTPQ